MTFRTAALAAFGALLVASPAGAASPTSVSAFSDTGEPIGGGSARVFIPPTADISVSGTSADVTVHAVQGSVNFSLRFVAPAGQDLRAGVYDEAESPAGRPPGTPGMRISEQSSCSNVDGRFEVRDIVVGQSGTIDRLWIVYEQRCEGRIPALFGEIRFNEQGSQSFAPTAPFVVRWPAADLGRKGRAVPVTLVAEHSTKPIRTLVKGSDAASFPVRSDECIGKTLASGSTCQVWMAFDPSAAGTRTATLHVEDARGGDNAAILQGFAYGGVTRVVLSSDAGDYIGAGKDWSYTPANALIEPTGTRQHVEFSVNGADGTWWNADLAPGSGDILAPGQYNGAHRYPFQGIGPGLNVSGNGRGCNMLTGSFSITQATFDDDGPTNFASSFEQHCEGAMPALRGHLDFRAGDNTTPAPWMTSRTGASSLQFTPAHTQPTAGPCSGDRFANAHVIVGTSGNDTLAGTPGMDIIIAGPGMDVVGGGNGDDCLHGGLDGDRVVGGSGDDVLAGAGGDDLLIGGAGADRFICGDGDDDNVYADAADTVDADCEVVHRS